MRIKLLFILLISTTLNTLTAQTVWENTNSDIYPYLSRMAQKGLIDFQDIIRPVSRQQITDLLLELEKNAGPLSKTEKEELSFYLKEYRPIALKETDKIHLIKKDENARIRGLYYHSKDFQMNADPVGGFLKVSGTGKDFTQISNGVHFWGQAKRFAFQFYYHDYTEKGKGVDSFRNESPEPAIIKLYNPSSTNQNFSEVRANLSYTWKEGSISIGKDQLLWGYGENGRIVLSDKAPTYPYIRFDYKPFKWMQFNYEHAWLNSNIIDSAASYRTGTSGVYGDQRIQYIPKFMATHSLIIKPTKGLDIAIGESIIYSDKMDVGFLIPVNFFKIYDNNRSNYVINAGSNGQLFMQVSSRNHIKNTHLYGTMFIDEIRVADMFNSTKARNQFGFTLGGSVTDAFIPYVTIGAEYTRVNPFVYSNLLPAQSYSQYQQPLGDWMDNNFDRQLLYISYHPIPRFKAYLRYQSIRKGGPGSIAQQYLAIPQPAFLSNYQKKRTDIFAQISYELINNVYLNANYQVMDQTLANGVSSSNNMMQIGFMIGLK